MTSVVLGGSFVVQCVVIKLLQCRCPMHAGAVARLGRKKAIYQICQQEDIIILEDDPYYYLQFRTGPGAQPPLITRPRLMQPRRSIARSSLRAWPNLLALVLGVQLRVSDWTPRFKSTDHAQQLNVNLF